MNVREASASGECKHTSVGLILARQPLGRPDGQRVAHAAGDNQRPHYRLHDGRTRKATGSSCESDETRCLILTAKRVCARWTDQSAKRKESPAARFFSLNSSLRCFGIVDQATVVHIVCSAGWPRVVFTAVVWIGWRPSSAASCAAPANGIIDFDCFQCVNSILTVLSVPLLSSAGKPPRWSTQRCFPPAVAQ